MSVNSNESGLCAPDCNPDEYNCTRRVSLGDGTVRRKADRRCGEYRSVEVKTFVTTAARDSPAANAETKFA
jgi:hypothetical protein